MKQTLVNAKCTADGSKNLLKTILTDFLVDQAFCSFCFHESFVVIEYRDVTLLCFVSLGYKNKKTVSFFIV